MAQPLDRGRRLYRDVADDVILEHPTARHVAGLRFAFAPCRHLDEDRKLLRLADAALEPFPRAIRIGAIGLRRSQDVHLSFNPAAAPAFVEISGEMEIDIAEVGYVRQGISDLCVTERATSPVCEAMGFVQRVAGDALDKLVVRN